MTDDKELNRMLMERYDDYYLNDDGEVMIKRKGYRKEPDSGDLIETTYKVNLTTRFRPGRRYTSKVPILVIEAELYDETGEVGNAAHPINDDVEASARRKIEAKGLTPAWEASVP